MPDTAEDRAFFTRVFETSVRIALIVILIAWCFQLARPFIQPVVWAAILAVALNPLYQQILRSIGDRKKSAAAILVLVALAVLIMPAAMLTTSMVGSATELANQLQQGSIDIPPPPASVAEWPLVGGPLFGIWNTASNSVEAALLQLQPQLKAIGRWGLSTGAEAGFGLILFILSIVIAGALLAYGDEASGAVRKVANRLSHESGDQLVDLATATVHSVTRGILGVALIQSVLAGLAMLVVGIPLAGLLALLILLMGVVQLPSSLIMIPVVVYVFFQHSMLVAIPFAIWMTIVSLSDNVLKPILLGRGVDVPMLVIFIGAIGGFVRSGIIGMFVGAVVLCVGYTLFRSWLESAPRAEASQA